MMQDLLDTQERLLNEKAEMLKEREVLMAEELEQLKAELAEQKRKTKEVETIAEEAIERAMDASKNWEKEKTRRKLVEDILDGIKSTLHHSVSAQLLRL
jgi:protein subunit release factor B